MEPLTRRQFLKLAGVVGLGGALSACKVDLGVKTPSFEQEVAVGEYKYLFQVDLPPNYALVRSDWFESVSDLSRRAMVSVEQLKRENGIGDDNKVKLGEYLLVPISAGATENYIENDDPDLEKQLIVRAVRNPLLLPENDFTDQEILLLNRLLRWAESVKKKYIGDIDMTRGFARLMRATEAEMSSNPANVSGEVRTMPACSLPSSGGGQEAGATIECKQGNAMVILLYPGVSSLKGYEYFESLQPGYGIDRYISSMANVTLHERLHTAFFLDWDISPFDNHRLVYAIASLASDKYFPDNGYMVEGHKIPGSVYMINSFEWYLIRQNPDFFKKLLPHYLKYYQKEPPSPTEVEGWINGIYPDYFRWRKLYDAPITVEKTSKEGKQFVWTGKTGAFDEVTWAVPVYSVRWPQGDEIDWLLTDFHYPPVLKDGMLLYRSWKVVGVSKTGEVPDFIDTATAVAFSSNDPNYFSDSGDGKKRVSPTMEAVYSVGEWK